MSSYRCGAQILSWNKGIFVIKSLTYVCLRPDLCRHSGRSYMESLWNLDDPFSSLLRFIIVGEFIEFFFDYPRQLGHSRQFSGLPFGRGEREHSGVVVRWHSRHGYHWIYDEWINGCMTEKVWAWLERNDGRGLRGGKMVVVTRLGKPLLPVDAYACVAGLIVFAFWFACGLFCIRFGWQ